MLLRKFSVFKSSNIDDLERLVVTVASGKVVSARHLHEGSVFRCSSVSDDSMPIFYLSSRLSSNFEFAPVDYMRIVFQIEGGCHLRIGKDVLGVGASSSYILPAGVSADEAHPDGYRSLAIRLNPDDLQRRLATLTGADIAAPIQFDQSSQDGTRFNEYIRQHMIAAAREVDYIDAQFRRAYMFELSSLLITRILLHTKHNYSSELSREKSSVSDNRIRKAEEYIQEFWNNSITIDELAAAANCSGRTLVRRFSEIYGETPAVYMRRIRLQNAHKMLAEGLQPSVLSVALQCGFSSFGHFAEAYRRMFGELPSATVRRGTGIKS